MRFLINIVEIESLERVNSLLVQAYLPIAVLISAAGHVESSLVPPTTIFLMTPMKEACGGRVLGGSWKRLTPPI